MTNLDVSPIEARVNAATEGPWGEYDGCKPHTIIAPKRRDDQRICGNIWWKEDADFILNARTDIPDLIAEVRRLEAENARMIERIAELERKAGERG